MKRFLMYFTIFFTTPVCMANEYSEMLQKCDKMAESEQKSATSTVQIVQTVNNQKNCYKALVYKIIDTEYAKNKQQMTSDFDNFIKNFSDAAYSMQYPDKCSPDCGTIVGSNAAKATLEIIKTYIQQLLYVVSPE